MPTMEQVRAKIRRNFPTEARTDKPLTWDRETATTIVSTCGRFRISKFKDRETGHCDYHAYTIQSPTAASRKIAGPFITAKECREAVQAFVKGEPMQADLA